MSNLKHLTPEQLAAANAALASLADVFAGLAK